MLCDVYEQGRIHRGAEGAGAPLHPCIAWSPPKSPQYFLAMDEVEEEGKEEEEEEKERKEEEEGEISPPV